MVLETQKYATWYFSKQEARPPTLTIINGWPIYARKCTDDEALKLYKQAEMRGKKKVKV